MIQIKMRNKKWRISISDENWEFDSLADFKKVLESLIINKDKFGKIQQDYLISKSQIK